MAGGAAPAGPGYSPPQIPPGQASGPSATAQLQLLQAMEQTLNAILTQLRNGIALSATLPTFLFANLPAATTVPGMLVFVSDARKPGEGAGSGTGLTAYSDGVSWYGTTGTILQD
jgi:hypothetical protein